MEHSIKERKRHETEDAPASRRFPTDSPEVSLHPLLHLQQRTGNQAVQELLKSGVVQAKLAISQYDASEEQEAERMDEQVMRALEPGSADVQERLQMKAAGAGSAGRASASVPPVINEVLQSLGQPLDPVTRAFFEPRFGEDFSGVRIHTGAEAEASASSLRARAYTTGEHIVFAEGRYAPSTDSGKRLLAHELTHVVQQRSGRGAQSLQRSPDETQPQGNSASVTVQSNCSDVEARAIALSILKSQRMLNAALDWFRNSSPENDVRTKALLRSHFGSDSNSTWSAVHQRLTTISAILEEAGKGHVNLNCVGAKDAVCSKNEFYAYVRTGAGYIINFCREFFSMTAEEQVWGLIHETAHLAGAHGDNYIFTFGPIDSNACFGDQVQVPGPLGNADSYTSFVWCLVAPGTVVHPEFLKPKP